MLNHAVAKGRILKRAVFGLTSQPDGGYLSPVLNRTDLGQLWLGNGSVMYGGLLIAQAMSAAAFEELLTPHSAWRFQSVQAYFLKPGNHSEPVRFIVERLTNNRQSVIHGSSIHLRRVTAYQRLTNSPIMLCQMALTSQPISAVRVDNHPNESPSGQISQPISAVRLDNHPNESPRPERWKTVRSISAFQSPEALPTQEQFLEEQLSQKLDGHQRSYLKARLSEARLSAIDLRPLEPAEFFRLKQSAEPSAQFWIRLKPEVRQAVLGNTDQADLTSLTSQVLLAFLSDKGLLRSGEVTRPDEVISKKASLDHRLVFHEETGDPFSWNLYQCQCVRSGSLHRLNLGHLLGSKNGKLIFSASQQSLTLVRVPGNDGSTTDTSSKL